MSQKYTVICDHCKREAEVGGGEYDDWVVLGVRVPGVQDYDFCTLSCLKDWAARRLPGRMWMSRHQPEDIER